MRIFVNFSRHFGRHGLSYCPLVLVMLSNPSIFRTPGTTLMCSKSLPGGDKQEIQGEVKDIQSQKYLQKKPQNTKHVKQNVVNRQCSDFYHRGSSFL